MIGADGVMDRNTTVVVFLSIKEKGGVVGLAQCTVIWK